jgi:hypothetical protein
MRASLEGLGRNAQKIIATRHFYHRLPLASLKQIDSKRLKSWKFSYKDIDTIELDKKSPLRKQTQVIALFLRLQSAIAMSITGIGILLSATMLL